MYTIINTRTIQRMKKRILSTVIAVSLIMGTGIQSIAAPLTDAQKQQKIEDTKKLDDINSKVKDLEKQMNDLTDQIELVYSQIEKNKNEIAKVKNEIKSTQKQVDKLKEDLKEKETVLGDRMRAVYKTGTTENYLGVILSSTSFSDLITKFQAVGKVVTLDNKIIDELNSKKAELDDKVKNLNTKNEELDKLNIENKAKLDEFNKKKDEQKSVISQLNQEKGKIEVDLAAVEKPMVQPFIDVINNSGSSIDDLTSARDALRNIRTQIKSPAVDADLVKAIEKAKSLIEEKQKVASSTSSVPSRGGNGTASSNSILNYASQFLGRPYVWGAHGPGSFDCSGFTSYVFGHFGYGVSGTTYDQINQGTPVSYNDLQPGDLVFERGSASAPSHVAIYWGNGQIIHASNPRDGVKIGPISDYVAARRVLR
ncbi:N-terminal domain of peptidoglycan hydrolase CwlO-containing protein [Clostridium cavendishii DSM 21758]|uniref:N-terminal domain of peptidoglycan hydrolase CwlO-containing protein n=1 Tax=Clostridium cavendishii DSM 21758 TaxID=1121302 RepID=A0A1M6TRQ4_9CLOT|nr:NlpC/P60 family protein [Clostridium cavendishii]SHK59665.1 N-terminal domain of peptidoglycan hydrolase CwlO-containing protein [Clostridium cavendishii DSM 21758]